jgi:hypothetical protein
MGYSPYVFSKNFGRCAARLIAPIGALTPLRRRDS